MSFIKFIRIFLLVLIIIGIGLLITQKIWVPKVVDMILKTPNYESEKSANLSSDFLLKYPLLTLMRKTPAEIGCMLETEFSFRDPVFNCDNKNYVNNGDPCIKTEEYYEGVKIPPNLIKKISPVIQDINLSFEHGNLQKIAITFDNILSKDEIRQTFNLPLDESKFPNNIMAISYGENIISADKPTDPNYTKWLSITGFEHIGAGDVNCK